MTKSIKVARRFAYWGVGFAGIISYGFGHVDLAALLFAAAWVSSPHPE